MKTITLLQIQSEAKKLQNTQNITYNQSLQIIAQQNGFKSYQAILNKIKKVLPHKKTLICDYFK